MSTLWPSTPLARRRLAVVSFSLAAMILIGFWATHTPYRVERTRDNRICGIEQDILPATGKALFRRESFSEICRLLRIQDSATCPLISDSTRTRCASKNVFIPERVIYRHTTSASSAAASNIASYLSHDTGLFDQIKVLAGNLQQNITAVGGDDLSPSDRAIEFPSDVDLDRASGQCSATLVGPRALITAAHCLGQKNLLKSECGAAVPDVDLLCTPMMLGSRTYPGQSNCAGAGNAPGCELDVALCKPVLGAGDLQCPNVVSESVTNRPPVPPNLLLVGRGDPYRI